MFQPTSANSFHPTPKSNLNCSPKTTPNPKQQYPTSSYSLFSQTFTDQSIFFLLNVNIIIIFRFPIITIFIGYCRNECDSMAIDCGFNCLLSF